MMSVIAVGRLFATLLAFYCCYHSQAKAPWLTPTTAKVVAGRASSTPPSPRRAWSVAALPRGGSSAPPWTVATTPAGPLAAPNTNATMTFRNNQGDELIAPATNVTSAGVPPPFSSWRSQLPTLLQNKGPRTLQKLTLRNVDIYLLGTAHVSNDSSRDVQILLDFVHPDAIFVELCEARIPLLEGGGDHVVVENNSVTESVQRPSLRKKVAAIRESQGGTRWQAWSTTLLTSVQEDYAEELGVELGGEFRQAYTYWNDTARHLLHHQPYMILGDRPLHLTLTRAWESLSWWGKLRVLVGLCWSSCFKPNRAEIKAWLDSVMQEESDVLSKSLDELKQSFPSLHRCIIQERDAWLAAKLTQTCRALPPVDGDDHRRRRCVVAIVGAGHVPGICAWLCGGSPNGTLSPEQILTDLCQTKRWAQDAVVQSLLPKWIHEVTLLDAMSTDEEIESAAPTTT